MGHDFSYSFDYGVEMGEFSFVYFVIYFLIVSAIPIALYVMQAIGLYSIAKRRGIRKPWLAWVPVGDSWILGSIADQYRYVAMGQVKNKRKSLLVLSILMYASTVGILALFVTLMVRVVGLPEGAVDQYMMTQGLGAILAMFLLYFVLFGVAIGCKVIQYMALYDLYASCEPGNKVLYLVLNIFINVTLPVFLLVCRDKDYGMPPRKRPVEPVQAAPEPWDQNPQEEEPWHSSEE